MISDKYKKNNKKNSVCCVKCKCVKEQAEGNSFTACDISLPAAVSSYSKHST